MPEDAQRQADLQCQQGAEAAGEGLRERGTVMPGQADARAVERQHHPVHDLACALPERPG